MQMSRKICCVPGCWESGRSHKTLHTFPNPEIERERFNKWVLAIGGDIISLDNKFIYEQRRICRAHFEEKYLCHSNRISNIALPTLNLPGFMNVSRFPSIGRRPLMSTQNTPEPLPSTPAGSHKTLHTFPNPEIERERFNKWVLAIGGDIISLDNKFIYEQRRICRAHFEEKYLCHSNRISNIALPTLNLPGFMNVSRFPSIGRRPLMSTQNTPEPLPSTPAENNILKEDCKETEDVLLFFDNLFDSVNGSYATKENIAGPNKGLAC